jgi:hypothetical protein
VKCYNIGIQRHSNAIKPFLKKEKKRGRLKFCISMFDGASLSYHMNQLL